MGHSDIQVTASHLHDKLSRKTGFSIVFFESVARALAAHQHERDMAKHHGRAFFGKSDAGYVCDLLNKAGVPVEIDEVIRLLG